MSYVDGAIEDARVRAEATARGEMSRPRSVSAGALVAWFACGEKPDDNDTEGLALWGVAEVLTRQSVRLGEFVHETPLTALRRTIPRDTDGRPALPGGWDWADDETSRVGDSEDPEVCAWYPGPLIEADTGAHWTHVLACIVDACENSERVTGPDEWKGQYRSAPTEAP